MEGTEFHWQSSSNRGHVHPIRIPPASTGDDYDAVLDSFSNSRVVIRTGTTWTAVAHVIAGVIGTGVLSLAWSVAQLGWIAGPCLIVFFAAITLLSCIMLCDCYKYPDPMYGPNRVGSFTEAVRNYMGEWSHKVCGVLLNALFFGSGVAYVITAGSSVKAIWESNCYHREGHDATCSYIYTFYMILFGGVQIIVSQIPNFHSMEWLSWIAATMSVTYSSIALGLGIAKIIENGRIEGSLIGTSTTTGINKLWLSFEAFGDIAFAFSFTVILLEIQDTLKSPPPENENMKKASSLSIFIITSFYMLCGCSGYAAFGDNAPGNLLSGFGFYEPYWLIDFANACIVLHLVGGYQIYSQPVFMFVEGWARKRFPNSEFMNKFHRVKVAARQQIQINPFRLVFRSGYVILSTTIAVAFPYFNEVLGLLGAASFWPLGIYFPVEMYAVRKGIRRWTGEWIALKVFSSLCLVTSIVGLIGSTERLIRAKKSSAGLRQLPTGGGWSAE